MLLLQRLLVLQLLDALLQAHDAGRLEDEGVGEVGGQDGVDDVLDLVEVQRGHDVQFVQLLLFLQLLTHTGRCLGV